MKIAFYPLSTLWYLYALFVLVLLRVLIYKINLSNYIVLLICLFLSIISNYIDLPIILEGTVIARLLKFSFYFQLGIITSSIKKFEYSLLNCRKNFLIFSVLFFVIFLFDRFIISWNLEIINIILAVVGVGMIIYISNCVSQKLI